ncbi:MAG TPA: hypothetical protein DCM73_06720 [Clostridiales bacterium]|nr:hypothetical protein [Clostridiales bacterium]
MRNFFFMLKSYLKQSAAFITVAIICSGIFFIIFSLYSIPTETVVYASLLSAAVILTIGILKFLFFYKKHQKLIKLKGNVSAMDFNFPPTLSLIEKDYQELIKTIDKSRMKIINDKNQSYSEMVDYYTTWAHQIKTPIAAMRLILQSEKSETNSELLEQLFRTEQYVEMVLQYLRLENLNNDLLFKRYPIDDLVKQAVRKYSKSFIRQKIKLNYENLNRDVLTDEKWLVFVIEQILSNALKYTREGSISIYMDEVLPYTLVIEDTGIGIEQEDLPRVFEKGFTGYNGRSDKKSTGIGLYLCKQILNRLSHTIKIESVTGKGSKVKIGLDVSNITHE